MKLKEAIKHCEEKARECGPCAADHKQLARWLKELKRLRAYERTMESKRRDLIGAEIKKCIGNIFGPRNCDKYETAADALAAYTQDRDLTLSPEAQDVIWWLFEKEATK